MSEVVPWRIHLIFSPFLPSFQSCIFKIAIITFCLKWPKNCGTNRLNLGKFLSWAFANSSHMLYLCPKGEHCYYCSRDSPTKTPAPVECLLYNGRDRLPRPNSRVTAGVSYEVWHFYNCRLGLGLFLTSSTAAALCPSHNLSPFFLSPSLPRLPWLSVSNTLFFSLSFPHTHTS